jgi:cytochrome c553
MRRASAQLLLLAGAATGGLGAAQTAEPDLERARLIVSSICVACHGADGYSPLPANPKVAGLQPQYIVKQLKDYKSGSRKSGVMAPMVERLTEAEMAALAAYYSAEKPAPGVVKNPDLLALGKQVYMDGNVDTGVPSCSGCHYPDGSGTPRFPRLAGQHAEYVAQQLHDFRTAKRDNDRGLVMQSLAERMTDREIRAVSEFIASLP